MGHINEKEFLRFHLIAEKSIRTIYFYIEAACCLLSILPLFVTLVMGCSLKFLCESLRTVCVCNLLEHHFRYS